MNRTENKRFLLPLLCAVLFAVTMVTYWPALQNDFINWDDRDYVTDNDWVRGGVTWNGVVLAFTKNHSANWHPLTWISHMIDASVYGLNPMGHHLTNILFHCVNAVLVFLLLHQLTELLWHSILVAALFALHPQHVESVAWVSERKDMLSAFFGFLSLMAYAKYALASAEANRLAKTWYGASIGFFTLGLMSKAMLVTWPVVMLLLDVWPLKRLQLSISHQSLIKLNQLTLEKVPFLILTSISCVVTILAQQKSGAVVALEILPIGTRLQNAVTAYTHYIEKFFWPQELSPINPLHSDQKFWHVIAGLGFLAVITTVAWRARAKHPYILSGWLWFIVTLVPVIGIVQVGNQAYADRYTYLPTIGIAISCVWLGAKILELKRPPNYAILALALLVLGMLAWRTSQQILIWKNTETLFARVLVHHPDNIQALNGLGGHLVRNGRIKEGVRLLERAHTLQPTIPEIAGLLADTLINLGRYAEALKHYQSGLLSEPNHTGLLNNLAWFYAACPDKSFRDGAQAERLARRTCELTGWSKPLFIGTLAAAQAEMGNFQEAITTAKQAANVAENLHLYDIVARNRELIELYLAGKAAHGKIPSANK